MARGLVTPKRRLSEDAIAALQSGNVDELLRLTHEEFGSMVMMADDADDDDDDDDDTGGDGGDDGGKGGSSDSDKDDGGDDDSDDDDKSELEKLRARMKAADKRADKAERALRDKERAEQSDLERAKGDLEEITKERDTLAETVSTLRLENAFLTANTQTWHDPDTALALAQSRGYLDDVVDSESGEVDKKELKKALERLAKEHKYLVKSEKNDQDDDDDDLPESGQSGGGRSDNRKDEKAKRQRLQQRFPVLNR